MDTKELFRDGVRRYTGALKFPEDATADLLTSLEKILKCEESYTALCEIAGEYAADFRCHFTPLLARWVEVLPLCEVHPYTGKLALYLCLCDTMLSHYRDAGLDEQLFWDNIADFSYKLEECRLVHGINGTSVGSWYHAFFKLERFTFGRLQFELTALKKSYTCQGVLLPEGSRAVNVHIPRTGTRLDHDAVLAAYQGAKAFFAPAFSGAPVLFTCHSWLLDSWNLTVLSPDSNLRAFIADYEIVEREECADYSQLWRLFDCNYTGDPDALPQNTSLRRAYAARVKRGEPTAVGLGLFFLP